MDNCVLYRGCVFGWWDGTTPLQNCLIARHNGVKAVLEKVVGTTRTNLVSQTVTYVAGATVQIRRLINSNTFQLWYNGVQVGVDQTVSDAEIIGNTYFGLFSTHVSNLCGNFKIEPYIDLDPDYYGRIAWLTDVHAGSALWNAGEMTAVAGAINALSPDAIMITGDLTENDSSGDFTIYTSFRNAITATKYEINGNHDDPTSSYPDRFSFELWKYKFIAPHATYTTGSPPPGALTAGELSWTEAELISAAGKIPIVLCHPPLYNGWSGYIVAGNTELTAMLDTYNVPLFMSGHYHGYDSISVSGTLQVSGSSLVRPNARFVICDFYKSGIVLRQYSSLTPFAYIANGDYYIWV